VLEALAGDVAELVRARRAVEADRAKPRSNMRVLLAVTAVVLAATLVFAREYLAPFASGVGQVVLAGIVGVFTLGVAAMARITRIPETIRFLPAISRTPAVALSTADTRPGAGAEARRGSPWGSRLWRA